jgi:hypothetical protein
MVEERRNREAPGTSVASGMTMVAASMMRHGLRTNFPFDLAAARALPYSTAKSAMMVHWPASNAASSCGVILKIDGTIVSAAARMARNPRNASPRIKPTKRLASLRRAAPGTIIFAVTATSLNMPRANARG